jgi:hypothetical protein
MPVITGTGIFEGGSGTVSGWEVSVDFRADDCPPFGPKDLTTSFKFLQNGGNEVTTDSFGSVVRGGDIGFLAKGTVNGCSVTGFGGAGLVGTNPQRTDVQAALPHHTLQRIACRESGQRQFDAPPNGGTAFCPLFGPGGKVGVMQIAKPTDDEVWNWRLNVAKGIEIFNQRVDAATAYPGEVENSDKFKSLVSQFNQKRQAQGLNPIQVVVPPFEEGDFDANLQQLEMDAIRGYDGWNGADGFGLELHEFRVAVDVTGGDEVLVVTNINEQTSQGQAVWQQVPVADRPTNIGRPNYVEEVLAFNFDCAPSTVPLIADIRAEDATSPPCRILAVGKSRRYRAVVAPAGGTFKWTCTGGASIVGSASAELVTVKGNVESTTLDDAELTLRYKRGPRSKTTRIKLTVADVKKITVVVKASAALTPGRGGKLDDHQFDCTETVEAFPPEKSLILLRGDFEDVELQATVKPDGTPLFWDVKRTSDDAASLGTGLPGLGREPGDVTRAKLHTNETGSFFVRVCGDCGNQKFDANGPFKLLPTVLVRATLQVDASQTNPLIAQIEPSISSGGSFVVETGSLDIDKPSTAAIHMQAFVDVVSGGAHGLLLIDRVFAGWVNNERADKDSGSYTDGHSFHSIQTVFASNLGTGPNGIFKPGDKQDLVVPPVSDMAPLLDTINSGTGGETATVAPSRIRPPRTDLDPGQRWIVEAVASPGSSYPLLHPVFSSPAAPVRLQSFHFERNFTANLCLWTNRSGTFGDVADRSYGVLRFFEWDIVAAWLIDADNKITVLREMEVRISRARTKDPLVTPKDAFCEVCAPTALELARQDGSK